ncbi:hypothetical protein [Streptomyces sp. NBC_00370]
MARFRERLIELAVTVTTHPYWATFESGIVAGRMELKQITMEPTP